MTEHERLAAEGRLPGHDHGAAGTPGAPLPSVGSEGLDPSGQALAGALQTCFGLLKAVMLLLLALFCLSGTFRVKEGELALRMHWGALQDDEALKPGRLYFAWPEPIDRVIFLTTAAQQVSLDKEFWFHVAPEDQAKRIEELPVPKGGLVPGQDGSLLTSDKNLVHAQWTVLYKIEPVNAVLFVKNVGSLERAEVLVRAASQRSFVHMAARTPADDFVKGDVSSKESLQRIQQDIQAGLERLRTGLTVSGVLLHGVSPPLAVRASFTAVVEAESGRERKKAEARREETQILIGAAGAGYAPLLEAIDACERAARDGDAAGQATARKRIEEALAEGKVQGEAYSQLESAKAYKTQTVQALQSEAGTFRRSLPQFTENPRLYRERRRQDALQEIYSGDVEKFYLPAGGEVYLQVGRDPEIRANKEREKYREEQKPKK